MISVRRGVDGVFETEPVHFDEHSGGKLRFPGHDPSGLRDQIGGIPAANVHPHANSATPSVLALDGRGPLGDLDPRHLGQL